MAFIVIMDQGIKLQRSRYIRPKNVVTSYKEENLKFSPSFEYIFSSFCLVVEAFSLVEAHGHVPIVPRG